MILVVIYAVIIADEIGYKKECLKVFSFSLFISILYSCNATFPFSVIL